MSEKPFERLLIEIGTETGDLSKTIKELEKLQKMSAKGGAGFSGLRQFIEDAVTDALRKGGKGGGKTSVNYLSFLSQFNASANTILKELTGIFGPKRTTTGTSMRLMTQKSGMTMGQMYNSLIGQKEFKSGIEEASKDLNMDPKMMEAEVLGGLTKMMAFAQYGYGRENAPMQELSKMMFNRDFQELSAPDKIKRLRDVFLYEREGLLKSRYKSEITALGGSVAREVTFSQKNEGADFSKLLGSAGFKAGGKSSAQRKELHGLLGLDNEGTKLLPGLGTLGSLSTFGGQLKTVSAGGMDWNAERIRELSKGIMKTEGKKGGIWGDVIGEGKFGGPGSAFSRRIDVMGNKDEAKYMLDLLEFAGTPEQQKAQRKVFDSLVKSGLVAQEWKTDVMQPGQMMTEIGKETWTGLKGGMMIAPGIGGSDATRDAMIKHAIANNTVLMTPKSWKKSESALNSAFITQYLQTNRKELVSLLGEKGTDITKVQENTQRIIEILNGMYGGMNTASDSEDGDEEKGSWEDS